MFVAASSRCSAAVSGSAALFGVAKLPGDAARRQLVSFMVAFRNTRKSTPFFSEVEGDWTPLQAG